MLANLKERIQKLIKFLTYDIWRITKDESHARKITVFNGIKAIFLAFRNINSSQINTRAGALTYNTILSVVPFLAVLFAIARGFGFQKIIESQLFQYFSGQKEILEKSMKFIDKSLEYAQGGVFLGIGVLLLLYTVISLLSNIEDNFNTIWCIKKGRTLYQKCTDYLTLIIFCPVFILCNAGISISLNSTTDIELLDTVTSRFLEVVPFLLTILLFTLLYIYMPNTKVKFSAALFAGIIAGIAFQLFQYFYISGQIWIAKYNAIYGSFAALPLFLLWLQISWFICLFGVELSFAYQNVNKFSFEKEITNISRRYKNFVLLMITTLIIKRFEIGEKPYTADELSEKYKIPTQLTNESLFLLLQVGLILETPTEDALVMAYIPATDINHMTIDYFIDKIDCFGSEDFKIDIDSEFKDIWNENLEIRKAISESKGNVLLKDI